LDGKVDEAKYRKRFRYAESLGQKHSAVINMNSGELYGKLMRVKKEKKEDNFVIKPQKKLNTLSLHSALYKVKKQKE
jgi:hypothetical protein